MANFDNSRQVLTNFDKFNQTLTSVQLILTNFIKLDLDMFDASGKQSENIGQITKKQVWSKFPKFDVILTGSSNVDKF